MPIWKASKGEVPSPLRPGWVLRHHSPLGRGAITGAGHSSEPQFLQAFYLVPGKQLFTPFIEASLERTIYKTSGILWTAKISGVRIISTWGHMQQLLQQSLFQVSGHCNNVFVWKIINNLKFGTLFFQLICLWPFSSWTIETNIFTKQTGCNALGNEEKCCSLLTSKFTMRNLISTSFYSLHRWKRNPDIKII